MASLPVWQHHSPKYSSNSNESPRFKYRGPPTSKKNPTQTFLTRDRANTQITATPPTFIQGQQRNGLRSDQNRNRSSSWPAKPVQLVNSPNTKSRSNGRPHSVHKKNPSDSSRKKRKRLNPQRRIFYKALHNDFPAIAEALREARQGSCVKESLRVRDIVFTIIEARPPQDPTNLNVRRYNDMVFIWDPSIESWLQVNGSDEQPPELEPSLLPVKEISAPVYRVTSAPFLSTNTSPFPEIGSFTYEGPFVSDTSTSEDDEYIQGELTDFLPKDLL